MEFNVPEKGKDRKKGSRRPEQKLPGWREHLYLYDLHAFSAFFYLLCISSTESGVSNTKPELFIGFTKKKKMEAA
jgi:hypothetical protein